MKISPMDIQRQTLRPRVPRARPRRGARLPEHRGRGGGRAADASATASTRRSRTLRALLDEHRQRETILKNTLLTAQRVSEEIQENARKQAESVVKEAEMQADRLIELAQSRAHEVERGILDLRAHRTALRTDIRALITRLDPAARPAGGGRARGQPPLPEAARGGASSASPQRPRRPRAGRGDPARARAAPRLPRRAGGERDGALVVRLTAPPVEGEANAALVRFLARALGVPPSAVAIAARARRGRDKVRARARASRARRPCGAPGWSHDDAADLVVRNIGRAGDPGRARAPRVGAGAARRWRAVARRGAWPRATGRIVYVGPEARAAPPRSRRAGAAVLDAGGAAVLPGFVDAHTHLAFAGDRDDEIRQRLAGATYREIAAAGGGIVRTVAATRAGLARRAAPRLLPRASTRCCCRAPPPPRSRAATASRRRPSCARWRRSATRPRAPSRHRRAHVPGRPRGAGRSTATTASATCDLLVRRDDPGGRAPRPGRLLRRLLRGGRLHRRRRAGASWPPRASTA